MGQIKEFSTGRIITTQEKEHKLHKLKKPDNGFLMIQEDLRKVFERLIGDQEILKLLYYTTPDALEKEDITDSEILTEIGTKYIRMIPLITIDNVEHSVITLVLDHISPCETNPAYQNYFLNFEIMCPLDSWIMDDYNLRPFRLLQRVFRLFQNKKLNGIGTPQYTMTTRISSDNVSYSGYSIVFHVYNEA